MALSNKERVGRVLEALKDGLGPFILREFRTVYSQRGYANEIDAVLATPGYPGLPCPLCLRHGKERAGAPHRARLPQPGQYLLR